MVNLKYSWSIVFVLVLSMVSCQKESIDNQEELNGREILTKAKGNLLNVDPYTVSERDIANFIRYKNLIAEGENKLFSIEGLYPMETEDGHTYAYLLNYNNGWEIITADKRLPTVLAQRDSGQMVLSRAGESDVFDVVRLWVEESKEGLKAYENMSGAEKAQLNADSEVAKNIRFWELIDDQVLDIPTKTNRDGEGGHYELMGVTHSDTLVTESILNTATWKTAAPYTTYDNNTQHNLVSSILAVAKTIYYYYQKAGIYSTIPTDNHLSTVIWGNLSSAYNSQVGAYLSQLCGYFNNNGGGVEPESLHSSGLMQFADLLNLTEDGCRLSQAVCFFPCFRLGYSLGGYDVSVLESCLVQNEVPIIIEAANSRILWFISQYRSFLIDKYRRYRISTIYTYEWVDDDNGGAGLLPIDIHERYQEVETHYERYVGMNWGLPYDATTQTDGDDIWFSPQAWSVFGNTYQYNRSMVTNLHSNNN